MKKFLLKICVWFALKCRLYYVWSKIYRFFRERKHNDVVLPHYGTLQQLEDDLGKLVWREDDWTMLWDAISTPQATYERSRIMQERREAIATATTVCSGVVAYPGAGDCDDISLFAANRIKNRGSILRDNYGMDSYLIKVGLLSCPWLSKTNKAGGHNVCVFQYTNLTTNSIHWAHVSNWYEGKIQWGYNSLYDVVRDVVARKDCTSLGWALADIDLKLMEYHWSL